MTNRYFLICIIFLTMIGQAYSAGIGVYGTSGGGQMYYQKNGSWLKYKSISDTIIFGGGFIADTNPDGDAAFNYRLTVGYNYQKTNFIVTNGIHRVLVNNVFGISVVRNDLLKVWIGPQIGLGYLWGETHYHDIGTNPVPSLYYLKKFRFRLVNFNCGVSIGINFNIGEFITLPFEVGFRFHAYTNFSNKDNGRTVFNGINIMGPEGYALVGVMYRINKKEY